MNNRFFFFILEILNYFMRLKPEVYFVFVLILKMLSLGCAFPYVKWQVLYLFVEESVYVRKPALGFKLY